MSCMIAPLPGGDPTRELFPITIERLQSLKDAAGPLIMPLLIGVPERTTNATRQYVGAALRPDGTPFYLTTFAPDTENAPLAPGEWVGGFFAPFGVGSILGSVSGRLETSASRPTSITVKALLIEDTGGELLSLEPTYTTIASVEWTVRGSQATRANKASLIDGVTVHLAGPHDEHDIVRCIRLHAPQRCFGEPRAVVAMQCGIAAACLLEAIC